jgi:hypothetical protein
MKKRSQMLLLLLAVACQASLAQTMVVNGVVGNSDGQPLRYAFVLEKQLKNATYTDSLGRFSLTVNQVSQLTVSCNGYVGSTIAVDGHQNLQITLKKDDKPGGQDNSNADVKAVEDAFKPVHDDLGKTGINQFGSITFNNIKETVGSRFLFKQWVHGYLIKMNGDVIQTPALLLNYDKMTGDLYLTENLTSVMVGDKNAVKSFVLFSPEDQQYTFERMLGISADLYSQVLSTGSKYKLYKLTKTRFIPSNYKTDGIASTGNTYDEYADESSYYIMNLTTTFFQPLTLNKKSIKLIFADEGNKADNFLATHKIKQDDAFVKALGDAMNQ